MRKVVLFASLCVPFLAQAVEDKEVATCAAMQNTVSRLACYDSMAAKNKLAPSSETTTTKGAGKWQTSKEVDPLNDKEIHFALLPADSGKGKYGGRIAMMVRCQDNKTETYINWNSYLGSETIRTTYRLDKNPAQTSNWGLSTDKKAAFFPGSPVALLKQMADSQTFVANITPYNENPITATFDTSGADAAFRDIRASCKW